MNVFEKLRNTILDNNGKPLAIFSLAKKIEEKTGYPINRNTITRIEKGTSEPPIDYVKAYSTFFDVTSDFLLGLSENDSKEESYRNINKKTGLSKKSIDNLEKLNKNKPINGVRFDYALHTLNKILESYEGANLFELIYHYLYGGYNSVGHYDNNGEEVFDGSEVFLSDQYGTNKLSIDSKRMDAYILTELNAQLTLWKSQMEKENSLLDGKLLPAKETLMSKLEEAKEHKTALEGIRDTTKLKFDTEIKNRNVSNETILDIAKSLNIQDDAIEISQRRIDDIQHSINNLYGRSVVEMNK